MRISLCVICGNEEAIIERFLNSFGPAFDELSLCRAVGASVADRTAEIAAEWCASHGKDFRLKEHRNGIGAEVWTHVDDFAAARNEAFAGGTGDWLFWADCDDLLEHPEKLREVLADPNVGDIARFDYDVVGTNKRPKRERAVRRSAFEAGNRWHFAVHENLLALAGTKITDHPQPVWVHQPKAVAIENRKRNKAILSRTLQHASSNYFYVHQEWFCEGNQRNAVRFGTLALAFPDLEPSFRYETNLNLAKLTPDNESALRYALDAHAVFPWCREAKGMLSLLYIERNDPTRALHWARELYRTPTPPDSHKPWTHEPKWYGWAGTDLLLRCLRFAKKYDEALALEATLPPPKIALVHATRGRTAKAAECRNNWMNLAANPEFIEYVISVDEDDKPSLRIASQYVNSVNSTKSCVAAWNSGVKLTSAPVLIQLSDDWIPFPNWDKKLLEVIEASGKKLSDEWVLAISDGVRKDDLLCMAILSRTRLEKQGGEMFSSEYESMYSDNEFTHRAFRDGVVLDARSVITFRHHHPAFAGGKGWDETYEHNNRKERYERGLETFKRRNPDAP